MATGELTVHPGHTAPASCSRAAEASASVGGSHDVRVRAGEEESLVAVRPTHVVRRLTVDPPHLDHLAFPPRRLGGPSFDDHVVAHLCSHDVTLAPPGADC